jgi:hypothetical protein
MVRYVVLLRYGFRDLWTVLQVERAPDGTVTCWEAAAPRSGMAWSVDGRFRSITDAAAERETLRTPLIAVREPQVAYSIPGVRLLDGRVPRYDHDLDRGATVQVSGYAVLEEPDRVALQLVLVPQRDEPHHRETVGDRLIDRGVPDLWVVLNRPGDEPAQVAAVRRILRWPPPLQAEAGRAT